MNKPAILWLYRQLPELVSKGVLSFESAEKLKAYYGPTEEKTGQKTFLMIFGVIGVLLVGLGIILILAHNWANITRINRLLLSVGLLLAAQLTTGFTLYRKRDSTLWRESTAIFHMLMLGAAMALVGQTYHLTDDTDAFLLTWMLLSLPLIYLMRASGVTILYLIGITSWSASSPHCLEKQFVWVLFAFVLPHYWRLLTHARQDKATVLLSWCLNICFYCSFAATLGHYINQLGFFIYSSLFAINYMIGHLCFQDSRDGWRIPFQFIGLASSIGILFVLTFNSFWRHLLSPVFSGYTIEKLVAISLLLLVIGGNFLMTRQAGKTTLAFSLLPLIIGGAYVVQYFDVSGTGATLLMNSYLIFLSIGIIRTGVREHSIGIANVGMILLGMLIIARFLDSNFSFVLRGLVFVLLGISFIVTNMVLVRRKAEEDHEK